MRAVHYLNQFFAGLGGEEAAMHEPVRIDGAAGPGRGLGLEIAATLACGDDWFALNEDEAVSRLLAWVAELAPDVLVCGPAFGSGRYGYACGVVAREAAGLGIPVVAGMYPENPGVLAAEGGAYIVPTSEGVSGMRDALARMGPLARRLGEGETLGGPEQEGYIASRRRRNEVADATGAERAIEMLLAKLAGALTTEVAPEIADVAPPPPVDASSVLFALVTEAGCVPQGNPDRLPHHRASTWLRYSLDGVRTLSAEGYESVHGGFDRTLANLDPNRLVPLDAIRALEDEGRIGRLHPFLYTTTGNGTATATAARLGQEIAHDLQQAGVEAVLLTGT
jgi:betaine reductase